MSDGSNLDDVLRDWPYDPHNINVRITNGIDGRDVIQMRVDMGVLQLELDGRPDGWRPHDSESYYDYLLSIAFREGEPLKLDDDQCNEIDREFVQFYHRRICWLKLQNYRCAVRDADHTLGLMDLCREFSDDENWTLSHEQYRPFVLFHRTQAAALAELEDNGPEAAVSELETGLDKLRSVFEEHDAEDHFGEDELVVRLIELRDSLHEQFDDTSRLRRQLEEAVAAEEYERAAEIRDLLGARGEDA